MEIDMDNYITQFIIIEWTETTYLIYLLYHLAF